MRWKSQVRFGAAAARKPPAETAGTGASPPTLRERTLEPVHQDSSSAEKQES